MYKLFVDKPVFGIIKDLVVLSWKHYTRYCCQSRIAGNSELLNVRHSIVL